MGPFLLNHYSKKKMLVYSMYFWLKLSKKGQGHAGPLSRRDVIEDLCYKL